MSLAMTGVCGEIALFSAQGEDETRRFESLFEIAPEERRRRKPRVLKILSAIHPGGPEAFLRLSRLSIESHAPEDEDDDDADSDQEARVPVGPGGEQI